MKTSGSAEKARNVHENVGGSAEKGTSGSLEVGERRAQKIKIRELEDVGERRSGTAGEGGACVDK